MAEAMALEMAMPKNGEFCWTEIATDKLEACKSFYSKVFGWEMKESKATGEDFVYQEFSATPKAYPMGGMYQLSAEMCGGNELPPPHFINYISVENVDESASKVFDLGGKIVAPPMDIPNVGRFAIIQDPTGGTVALVTLKEGGQ
jgi:predicted enzyme related to lactoylglutathione lyase